MLPFLLILGIFLFFTLVGKAVLTVLKVRFGVLWSWLLAPTLGMGVTILCVNAFSKWGHPIKATGPGITIFLAIASLGILLWKRPAFPLKKLLPVIGILIAFLLYTGSPMFRFGFNWISYGNDDMSNYTLAAERFLNDSYYFLPEQTELQGKDYSKHFWFMHALQQIRPGSEMLLSWACSVTGINPHQAFMPVIFALSLLQLCSLGALVLYRGRHRLLAVVAIALLAISPLFTLGTLYQLIAQVGGISILICACSLMLRTTRFNWGNLVATGILVASMGVTYPEVAPFVVLSICLYAFRLRYLEMEFFPVFVKRIGVIAALTFAIMGINTYQFINTLVLQSLGSAGLGAMADLSQLEGLVLFPWTLVPSFLPMIFGLHPFGVVGTDPFLSILIALGLLMFVYLGVRTALGAWRGIPASMLGAIMIPLGGFLFFKGQDFGLFKLGMFAQPIIAFALAQAVIWGWKRRKGVTAGIVLVYAIATIPGHNYYVRASIGDVGGGLSEVVGASESGVAFTPPPELVFDAVASDITNVVSAKMLAMYTRGIDTRFLSRNYMDNVANIAPLEFLRDPDPDFGDQRSKMLRPLHMLRWMLPDELMTGHVASYDTMAMRSIDNSWSETSFRHLDYKNPLFVALQSKYDHFNKFASSIGAETGWQEQGLYMFKPLSEVKDRLIFIHSEKGPHYYSSARFRASFFQREPEPVSGYKEYFHGTGRYTMFQVFNPSSQLRMVVDFTRTSLGGDRSYLPSTAVITGDEAYPIAFVGSGSARVFTQPIKPQMFEGLGYVTLDFGENGQMIFKEKTGLMNLYGLKYNLDDRRLVGFTRDISVITEEQYQNLKRPTKISRLPQDLYDNPGLEYSGLFEDGWMSNQAYLVFGPAKRGDFVSFQGVIPETPAFNDGGVTVIMTINGDASEPVLLRPGPFTLNRFVHSDSPTTKIEFLFSKSGSYGTTDLRNLSAYINEISLQTAADLMPILQSGNRVGGDNFRFQGIDVDGWTAKEADFHLPPSANDQILELEMEIPGWATENPGAIRILVDGTEVAAQATALATYMKMPVILPAGAERVVTLYANNDFPLPDQADKRRSYRITRMTLRDRQQGEVLQATQPAAPAAEEGTLRFVGTDVDGWASRIARLVVPSANPATGLELELEFPGWAAAETANFVFTLNGRTVYSETLTRGVYKTVRIPLDAGRDNEIVLESNVDFPLPAPDSRVRSYRIVKMNLR